MWQIRIYDEYEKYGGYNDECYDPENDEKDSDCLKEIICINSDNPKDLLKVWDENLDVYEGMTYCIRDLSNNLNVIGGVYDPNDYDSLCDYFDIRNVYDSKSNNVNNRERYIVLYAEDFVTNIWEEYCEAAGVSSSSTEIRINFDYDDVDVLISSLP